MSFEYKNQVSITGRLQYDPRCGKSKAPYAFMKLEQPKGKSSMRFEVAFFYDPALAVAALNLRAGDVVDVIAKVSVRRKQNEETQQWESEFQLIGDSIEVLQRSEAETGNAPGDYEDPPAEAGYGGYADDDRVPF